MNLNCTWAYNDLFIGTRNNVAQCCMQGAGWPAPNWLEIDDLNDWYSNFMPFNDVREQHKNNIQNDVCKRCWKYENNNMPSPRTRSNLHRIRMDGKVLDIPQVKNIEMRFSNKCNLRCRMCDANSSNQIENLVKELRAKGIENNTYVDDPITYNEFKNIEKLLDLIVNCSTIEKIELAGGEPFIMPEVEWLLEELVKKNKTDLEIKFITNVTSAKPRMIELLKKFRRAHIDCSIDGVGKSIEYQRYPVKWKTIESNLKTLYDNKGETITFSFCPCIGQLNLLDFPDLIDFARDNYPDFRWGFNLISTPSYLDFRLISLSYRKELFKRTKNLDISFMSRYMQKTYRNFFEKTIYEYREITEKERKELQDAVYFWDYKSKVKARDQFPWIEEIL